MSAKVVREYVGGLPNICGSEELVAETMGRSGPFYLGDSGVRFESIRSAFAIALHMHQPLIPAGGADLWTARVISNLEYMMDHPEIGDNHNAPEFCLAIRKPDGEMLEGLKVQASPPAK